MIFYRVALIIHTQQSRQWHDARQGIHHQKAVGTWKSRKKVVCRIVRAEDDEPLFDLTGIVMETNETTKF